MRRTLLTVTAVILLLTSCGGSDSSNAPEKGPSSTSTSGPGASGESTATVAEVDGDLLEPGDLPVPWVESIDATVHTFDQLSPDGTPAYAVSCPASLTAAAEGNTQCAAYSDEGGPYASMTATGADGSSTSTLLCQSGGPESLDFTTVAAIDAPVAVAGLGGADIDGRAVQATAYTTGGATEWFVARRPAGQDCPVVWDLGADDGTLVGVSATAAVLLPLADGPLCVFVVPEGLRTRPADAGTCVP